MNISPSNMRSSAAITSFLDASRAFRADAARRNVCTPPHRFDWYAHHADAVVASARRIAHAISTQRLR